MRYRLFAAVLAAALVAALAIPGLSDTVRVRLDYPCAASESPGRLAESNVSSVRTTRAITIPGFTTSVSSGDPALPCKTIYVAIPPNADPRSIKLVPGSCKASVMPGAYDIPPVPPAVTSDGECHWGSGKLIKNGRNAATYARDQFYPAQHVRVVGIGRLRSWKVVEIEFWPYCYNPVSGRLRAVTSPTASISFSHKEAAASGGDPVAAKMSGFISNRAEALSWYPPVGNAASTADYVIITTNAIASASTKLAEFAQFQSARGFTVRVVTETQWGGGTGDTAAVRIRNWLLANYLTLGIEYVLMIGNPNPTTGDVPMKMLWPRHNESSYQEAPSDYYYAALTGNWDRDKDGYAGESPDDFGYGGIDRIPEIYVGRIPCYGSVADVDSILEKTVEYESIALGDWSRRFLLPMKPLDAGTPCYQLGEQIRSDMLIPLDFDPVRIYDSTYGLNPPPERTPCDYDIVQDEWQDGAGLVFWMTHGAPNSASSVITSARCANLDDGRPAIVYAGSCYNGEPEESGNLGFALLKHGAVSTASASRVSWYYIGESDFTNSDSIGGLAYRYARYILVNRESCGRALMDSRTCGPLGIWPNHLVFNLFGDPSLAFDQPVQGKVAGKVLSTDGLPVPGALVQAAGGIPSAFSQSDGSYMLCGFGGDSADIAVSATGYYPQKFFDLPASRGQVTQLDIYLRDAIPGSISGRVLDIYGAPVYDASVDLPDAYAGTYSLPDGAYSFHNLVPGDYTITASKSSWGEGCIFDCPVTEGGSAEADVVLIPQTGNLITNGGFEDGFFDSVGAAWEFYSSPGYAAAPVPGFDRLKYGACSQKLYLPETDGEGHAGFYQTVSVAPGKTYTLVGWQRSHLTGEENIASGSVTARFGWDPTGGIDFSAPTVIWRDFDTHHDFWYSLFTDVAAYTNQMTVFLDVCRKYPSVGDECYVWFDAMNLVGPIDVPRAPVVTVDADWLSPGDAIDASWSSASADVSTYEYALATGTGENSVISGCEWVNAGLRTAALMPVPAAQAGHAIRVLVRGITASGLKGRIGASHEIRIVEKAERIAHAKAMADGTWVRIPGLVLSRMGDGPECYIQDADRVSGIRVIGDWATIPQLLPGTKTGVIGMVTTLNGERTITNGELQPSCLGPAPSPLGMANLGVVRPGEAGLSTSGLLVTVWGKVLSVSGSGFMISDGGTRALSVTCHGSVQPLSVGSYARVTGIPYGDTINVFGQDDLTAF